MGVPCPPDSPAAAAAAAAVPSPGSAFDSYVRGFSRIMSSRITVRRRRLVTLADTVSSAALRIGLGARGIADVRARGIVICQQRTALGHQDLQKGGRELPAIHVSFPPPPNSPPMQLVSREWQQVLKSANFRKKVIAASALGGLEEQQQPCAIACVSRIGVVDSETSSSSSSEERKMRVVDMKLSFVPRSFWSNPDSACYSMTAVGDGLVCIGNEDFGEARHYCVVNPLTRTFRVLPQPPFQPRGWLPLTATSVIIYGGNQVFRVATYDLTTTGGGGWLLAGHYDPVDVEELPWAQDRAPVLAMCAGEVYWFQHGSLRVLAPNEEALLVDAAEAVPLDGPAMALLGPHMDALAISRSNFGVHLLAHRGAVYVLAQMKPSTAMARISECRYERACILSVHGGLPVQLYDSPVPGDVWDVVCGVWRLARDRMAWEPVARLGMAELERITGLRCREDVAYGNDFDICQAYGVRELLCSRAWVRPYRTTSGDDPCAGWPIELTPGMYTTLLLGFNLDKGEWEVVHHEHEKVEFRDDRFSTTSKPLELRPDLFLS